MSGTIYDSDQNSLTGVVAGGPTDTTSNATMVVSVATALNEAPVYIFSNNYETVFQGAVLSFRYGVPYQLDPALLAFLTANSAPIVAA